MWKQELKDLWIMQIKPTGNGLVTFLKLFASVPEFFYCL
jgi:hypothetical protein